MVRSIEYERAIDDAALHLRLYLPPAPDFEDEEVKAWEEPVEMFSYLPESANLNPMFQERRVGQGGSGEVYPLPLIERIASDPVIKSWKAIHIENRYVRLMILPEIGGRIHVGLDKVSGYDFFYRQNVIKPALVGPTGPWISGGVEFNWPQHHRPATFTPVETEIERHEDGSVTVWCSDYDRASGMKGMHGVCLHPDRAVVEVKARLYNGTESVQTFLWWASVGARVHEDFQSFFPSDVRHVADHAKREMSTFPLAESAYSGVDYADRAKNGVPVDEVPAFFKPNGYPANDLSRYSNIPVPTRYMAVKSEGDFFGGYDHTAKAGFVHVANHHIAPGKKQWRWGNHDFGYAWDRSLTGIDGPCVELLAGVNTDNQPDFSFLAPGETKTFSQFWYPLRDIGVPLAVNLDAAIRLEASGGKANVSVCVTHDLSDAILILKHASHLLEVWEQDLTVEAGFLATVMLPKDCDTSLLSLELRTETGHVLNCSLWPEPEKPAPLTAVEPDLPQAIQSLDELYLTGIHLEQYRHATRSSEAYWREALRRDPSDLRCNHALAKLHLKRGEYALAEVCIRASIARATTYNGNPYDGEIFYTLGLVLRRLNRLDEAYAAFYKATWAQAWRSAGYHAVAEIDAIRNDPDSAIRHLELSLLTNGENLNARNLCATLLRRLDRDDEASDMLAHTSDLDRLDLWSRFLDGVDLSQSGHQLLSLGLLMERGGQKEDAIQVFKKGVTIADDGSAPLLHLALARCSASLQQHEREERHLNAAAKASPDYCFPTGLDHLDLLEYAIARRPEAARLLYYLGNLLFHHRRHEEAIISWQRSAELDAFSAQVWRNLGIGYINIRHDGLAAQDAFARARAASPHDARLVYEEDQLRKRLSRAS